MEIFVGNQIIEQFCRGFIFTFPKYRKSWNEVIEFCDEYDRDTPTYRNHFLKNTQLGTFFYNRFSLGFFGNLWLYMGMKGGWLRTYIIFRDENNKEYREFLESCLTEEMKDEIKRTDK